MLDLKNAKKKSRGQGTTNSFVSFFQLPVARTTHLYNRHENPLDFLHLQMTSPISTNRLSGHRPFPGEITDMIIDHLHSSKQALGIMGLVHSSWLKRTRFQLFAHIELTGNNVVGFFQLLGVFDNCPVGSESDAHAAMRRRHLQGHVGSLLFAVAQFTLYPESDEDEGSTTVSSVGEAPPNTVDMNSYHEPLEDDVQGVIIFFANLYHSRKFTISLFRRHLFYSRSFVHFRHFRHRKLLRQPKIETNILVRSYTVARALPLPIYFRFPDPHSNAISKRDGSEIDRSRSGCIF